jgi:hypothetical protein
MGDGDTFFESGIHLSNIDHFDPIAKEGVVESLFGQAAVKRHLSPFETWPNRVSGTGMLTLVPAAGCLSVTGALTATDAFAALSRPWTGF